MRKLKFSLVIIVYFFSCCTTKSKEKENVYESFVITDSIAYNFDDIGNDTIGIIDSIPTAIVRNKVKNVYELDTNDMKCLWRTKDILWVFFEKGKVYFDFSVSCGYWYKTHYVNKQKIVFDWDYNEDCTYDIGMKKTFGVSKVPIKGKPFGEFILMNDTTMKINYYYTEWVEKINQHHNSTIFPSELILDPRIFPLN